MPKGIPLSDWTTPNEAMSVSRTGVFSRMPHGTWAGPATGAAARYRVQPLYTVRTAE